MLFRNTRLINKLKWVGVFTGGGIIPIALLVLNAIAFEVNSGILFMTTYAAFHIFCPGFWFDMDSAFLIRNALPGSFGPPDNFIAFIFWSLLNGALYLAVYRWLKIKRIIGDTH